MSAVRLLSLGLVVATLTSCVAAPVQPPIGLVYTGYTAPIDTDADPSDVPSQSGSSSAHNILGLVAWGDAGVESAARAGGLSTVHHVDYRYLNFLFVYSRFTTIAYGE